MAKDKNDDGGSSVYSAASGNAEVDAFASGGPGQSGTKGELFKVKKEILRSIHVLGDGWGRRNTLTISILGGFSSSHVRGGELVVYLLLLYSIPMFPTTF
jgi:hypothetical protein